MGVAGGPLDDRTSAAIERQRAGGQAMADPVRHRMEAGFGRGLSHLRIHHGDEAARLNAAESARAFTTGRDIFFGAGQYRPGSPDGDRVLAHEIAHAVTERSDVGRRTIHRLDLFTPLQHLIAAITNEPTRQCTCGRPCTCGAYPASRRDGNGPVKPTQQYFLTDLK